MAPSEETSRATSASTGSWARTARPVGLAVAVHAGLLLLFAAVCYDQRIGIGHALFAWDAHWYVTVARTWYPHAVPTGTGPAAQSTLGFFPVLPLAIRLFGFVPGISLDTAGLVVTALAGLAAAAVVWHLVELDEGPEGATRGTALVLCAPGAFVLSMVYGEGLLVAFVAGSLLCLRTHRWVLAGILAGLASATDPLGAAVVVPATLAAVLAIRSRREYRSLWAVALAPVGVVGFFGYLWARTGTPLAWFVSQRRGWEQGRLATGVWKAFKDVADFGLANPNDTVKAVSFVVTAVLVVAFVRSRPDPILLAYVATILVLAFLSPVTGFSPRITLRAFPLLALVGARLRRGWFEAVLGLSTLTMAALATLAFSTSGIPFTP